MAASLLLAVFLTVLLRALSLGVRDYIRDARLAERIGRIGYDAAHGQVERITDVVLSERRR